jgi:hypothetical protein
MLGKETLHNQDEASIKWTLKAALAESSWPKPQNSNGQAVLAI